MKVLVDTPIWSLALRRRRGDLAPRDRILVLALQDLIHARAVIFLGPVRQEILSGISDSPGFERIREQLSAFADEPLDAADYEEAARCFNRLAARGAASSSTDCLICAVALNRKIQVFTLDRDFERYRDLLSVELYSPAAGSKP
ncbi:MAG: PIN domain-containing protein [Planctomycetes bacterium]|nr:PIN domain-containing protein [Planctomycetota bacterium]